MHSIQSPRSVQLAAGGLAVLALVCFSGRAAAETSPYFTIEVVDDQTGRGVPLVELQTTNAVKYYTDSAGIVAFREPGLMGRRVWFTVTSHGYEFAKDGLGFAGVALRPVAGEKATIKIKRLNIAERLYRLTGEGIYRDSVLVGLKPPIDHPVINGRVSGQDSVLAVPYAGRIYWFWGDTGRPDYPLGHFRTAGATSQLPDQGGLDPAVGVNLEYFVGEDGFSRPMVPLPDRKEGMVWIDGVMTVSGPEGRQTLAAHYALMKSLGETLEHGLVVFDDASATFRRHAQFDLAERWRCPRGHPIAWKEGGQDYYLFPGPFPAVRVKANLAAAAEAARYEAFTCLPQGQRHDKTASVPQRDAAGKLVWDWKADSDPIGQDEERQLIAAGKIQPREARFQLHDVLTGKGVTLGGGTFCYNEYRRKWILIGCERFGTSFLGEIWFAEADSPTGPWTWARKIVTHEKYSFYNPAQHPFFDQAGGRIVYFEGTYTAMFSGNPCPTPRYDYNQILYRLDLSDPRLAPPKP